MNTTKFSIIVAMSDNRVIGKDNMVPWHLRDDLIRLKHLSIGHICILGKKTYESMLSYYEKSGKPTMSQRIHIVITRDQNYKVDADKGIVVHSIEEALEKAKTMTNTTAQYMEPDTDPNEVIILGGEQIFSQTLPFVDRLYLTIVHTEVEDGDAFFPEYKEFTKEISKEEKQNEAFSYTFLTLER